MSPDGSTGRGAEWLTPRVEQHGLARYVQTLRERIGIIFLAVLLAAGAATAYVFTAEKVYEAQADLLVTPVPRENSALSGLGLIRDSSDPTRDVETAAQLVTTTDVAERVRKELKLATSVRSLLKKVDAEPVAQSNIVAITAQGDSPRESAALANAFGEAVVADRTEQLHRQVDKAIESLEARIAEQPEEAVGGPDSLRAQLSQLQALRGSGDPTVRLETDAIPPEDPASPKPALSIAAGIFAGLVLGIGGAFALQILDPRLRREEQLRNLYGLPVLARIPKETRDTSGALTPQRLSPGTVEAYRTLRAMLAASRGNHRGGGPRSILVTGPSPSEGKSTTAINLASSLALAGNRVILIEADLRRPSVGKAVGMDAPRGIVSVLLETVRLEDALVEARQIPNLKLLLANDAGNVGGSIANVLFLPAAQRLMSEAKELADYVIVDSPPLTEVIDTLPLAQLADDVLLVVRLGKSQLTRLAQLGELLAQHDIRPVGFAVVGVPSSGSESYYYPGQRAKTSRFGRTRSVASGSQAAR